MPMTEQQYTAWLAGNRNPARRESFRRDPETGAMKPAFDPSVGLRQQSPYKIDKLDADINAQLAALQARSQDLPRLIQPERKSAEPRHVLAKKAMENMTRRRAGYALARAIGGQMRDADRRMMV